MAPKRTLMEIESQQAQDEAPKKKPRKLAKMNTEQEVAKTIRECDSLAGMSLKATDDTTVEGMSFRDEFVRDRHLKRRGQFEGPMGKGYYKAKRAKFEKAADDMEQGTAASSNEPTGGSAAAGPITGQFNSILWAAMQKWNEKPSNKSELVPYLNMGLPYSKEDCAAVCNCVRSLNATTSNPESLSIATAIISWLDEKGAKRLYPDVIEAFKKDISDVLVQFRLSTKRLIPDTLVWAKKHIGKICLVLNSASVDKILKEQGSWANVRAEINEVCKLSIGMVIFGFSLGKLLQDVVSDYTKEGLALLVGQPLTMAAFEASKKSINERISNQPGIDKLAARRKVRVSYGKVEYQVPVASISEEVDIRASIWLRHHLHSMGKLVGLFCEDVLLPTETKAAAVEVEQAVFAKIAEARESCNTQYSTSLVKDFAACAEILKSEDTGLRATDKLWAKTDKQWFMALGAEAGSTILQKTFLDMLPNEDSRDPDASATLSNLRSIQTGSVYKFATAKQQAQIGLAMDAVYNITIEIPQDMSIASGFVQKVRKRAAFFLQSDDKSKAGLDAWNGLLESMEKLTKKDVKHKPTLKKLHVFSFLAEGPGLERLDKITKLLLPEKEEKDVKGVAAVSSAAAPSEKSSASTAPSSAKKAARMKEEVDAAAAAMFKF